MHVPQVRAEILHHHVHLTANIIHHQGDTMTVRAYQQNRRFVLWSIHWHVQQLTKRCDGICLILHKQSWTTGNARVFEGIQTTDSLYHNRRYGKLLLAYLHHHSTLNREAGWELHGESGSLSWRRLHLKRASQAGNAITHHVQTNTTPAFLAERLRCRETRTEKQFDNIAIRQLLIRANEVASYRRLAHRLGIDTGAIIAHSNDDLVAFIRGRKLDLACRKLPTLDANFRHFNRMVHSITNQVQQWPGDLFNHGSINLGLLAFHHELKFLVLLEGHRARCTIEARNHRRNGYQARLHQSILESGVQAILAVEKALTVTNERLHPIAYRGHVGDTFAQTTSKHMEFCIAVEFQFVEFSQVSRFSAGIPPITGMTSALVALTRHNRY